MRRAFPSVLPVIWMTATLSVGGEVLPARGSFTGGIARQFSQEVRELDSRHDRLVRELESLPVSAGENSGVRRGWHSRTLNAPTDHAWVQVDLGRSFPLEMIALVPAAGESGEQGGAGYGFPRRFRIEVSDDADFTSPRLVGDFTRDEVANPRVHPLVVDAAGQRARLVRVTITEGWPRRTDSIAALGELIVLSGARNVAVGRRVETSSAIRSIPVWVPDNLTDGQSLLGPPVGREPSPTDGFQAAQETWSPRLTKWVQVDLQEECAVDEVRLLPARPSLFVDSPGHGFPVRFRIELADEAGFANPRVIFDSRNAAFPHPGDNPVSIAGQAMRARHVRITATELFSRGSVANFALAELQVWSGTNNVALGRPVSASDLLDHQQFPRWHPDYLVDGYNSRQRLMELPDWLRGLARRREVELEMERLQLERTLAADAVLATVIQFSTGTLGGVVLLAGTLLWRTRRTRRQEVEKLRTRIAGDLHDEIGSQLGSIALAAQLAARRADDPAVARERLAEIERIARETNEAMHDIVWLLKPGSSNLAELLARMREASASLLRGHDYQIECPDDVPARSVPIEFTRNVYLLYKEALTNIVKHSRAKAVGIEFSMRGGSLHLNLRDDGVGFDSGSVTTGNGLANMRRRAGEIGATLRIISSPGQGTAITLEAPVR